MQSRGNDLDIAVPKYTPIIAFKTRARAAPKDTEIRFIMSGEQHRGKLCLIPSSAKKTKVNVVIRVFHINKFHCPLRRKFFFFEGNNPMIFTLEAYKSTRLAMKKPIPAPRSKLYMKASP